jgi:nucleoside-diphosphate-sugar epimerase
MTTTLVTGAGGFLGFALAERLLRDGHRVRGFSRGHYQKLADAGVDQYRGDLADAAAVDRAVAGCDLVFHVAALAGAWGSRRQFEAANVLGTRHLLAACRRHGVRHLVYTSTPSVVSRGTDLEGVDESLARSTRFKAHYPATKAIAEAMVQAADDAALHTVCLRPHLVWGPGDTSLLPRLVDRARAGKLRRIVSGGPPKLIDTTYIDDAVEAHLLAADRLRSERWRDVAGRVYFISSGRPVGTWTMIDRMLAAAGEPGLARTIPRRLAYGMATLGEWIYGALRLQREPPTTRWIVDELSTAHWFDITAARRDLGYAPRVGLDEGMQRLAAWWRSRAASTRGRDA